MEVLGVGMGCVCMCCEGEVGGAKVPGGVNETISVRKHGTI